MEIIDLMIAAVVSTATTLMVAGAKSYTSEKGKLLATKEDIGQITKIVESVKKDLEILSAHQISLGNEERLALINFIEISSAVMEEITTMQYIYSTDASAIENHITNDRAKPLVNLIKAFARVKIFVKSETLIKECDDIVAFINEYSKFIVDHLTALCISLKMQSTSQVDFDMDRLKLYYSHYLNKVNGLADNCRNYLYAETKV